LAQRRPRHPEALAQRQFGDLLAGHQLAGGDEIPQTLGELLVERPAGDGVSRREYGHVTSRARGPASRNIPDIAASALSQRPALGTRACVPTRLRSPALPLRLAL